MFRKCKIVIAILVFSVMQTSWALVSPQQGVEWTVDGQILATGHWDMGYMFDVDQPLSVIALGAFDENGDGFVTPNVVALFNAGGTMLASVTVNSADVLIGDFRYTYLADSVALEPGTYTVLSMNWGSGDDAWAQTLGDFTTADGISNILRQFRTSTGELNLIGLDTGCCSNSGYFGGNVLIGEVTSSSIPTLGFWMAALLVTMLLLLAAHQFHRIRQ